MASPPRLPAGEAAALSTAAQAMAAGGIVGLPTETVYGIGVVPSPEALARLIAAKGRAPDKGIPLLIDGLDQVAATVFLAPAARRLAEAFWPGPLTLVLPLLRPGDVPGSLTGGRDSLAVRLPDHAVPRALARQLGPIAVTSANRSGEPEVASVDELVAVLGAALALVIDDGPVRGRVPSSVVAVDGAGHISVLREGALEDVRIRAALGMR